MLDEKHSTHFCVPPHRQQSHTASLLISLFPMTSVPQLAKRALVTALLALASLLNVQSDVRRTSSDDEVRATYSRILSRASRAHVQTIDLNNAKIAWEQALAAKVSQAESRLRSRRSASEAKLSYSRTNPSHVCASGGASLCSCH